MIASLVETCKLKAVEPQAYPSTSSLKHPNHRNTRRPERGFGDERQAFARVDVDDGEHPEATPSLIVSERTSRLHRALARSGTSMGPRVPSARLRPPPAHLQLLLTIEPPQLLLVTMPWRPGMMWIAR